jgi:fluoroquinolone resistance protein
MMARLEIKYDLETQLKTDKKIYDTQNEIMHSPNSDYQNRNASVEVEEHLTLSSEEFLIKKREFKNLNWHKKNQEGLTFSNCTISNSNFTHANLEGLRLENCNIFNCNFENANIQDGFFENCFFYEKQTQEGCRFNLANLNRTEFHNCDISTNSFKRASAFEIIINNCRAQGCNFEFTNFAKIVSRSFIFSSAALTKTDFRYSNFEGVCLKKCDLSESKFVAVILSRANLEESDLTNTLFAPSEYYGLSIFKADLRNAEIKDIDIRKLDFSGVKICEWQMDSLIESLGIIVHPN